MSQTTKYVLVTGTNGGLGLGICTRLLDDFLRSTPASASLTLIFTTRSTRKGTETQQALQRHLSKNHPLQSVDQRIRLRPESVELTNLLSIRDLSRRLIASDIPHLNAVILNAGIGGWAGLDWPRAWLHNALDLRSASTWPTYKLGIAGLITPDQFPGDVARLGKEPLLGQIFCANVFGHYMLSHWLMPLLRACEPDDAARIVWVSSIEPRARHFKEDDLMALQSTVAYESSKRVMDLLALTFDNEVARRSVSEFTGAENHNSADNKNTVSGNVTRKPLSTPTMHTAQPGICISAIVSLPWILSLAYALAIYIARLIGSVWATASTYTAGIVFTWLAFAPADEILAREAELGGRPGRRVKWGASASKLGYASVRPTEVDGWGISGDGEPYVENWWAGRLGRAPGATEVKREEVPEFIALGGRVWREMEEMRKEWEGRIEEFERGR